MRFNLNKKGAVLVIALALFSAGVVYGQALKRWTWPVHRLSFYVPANFKVTHTAQKLKATDGKAFTYYLAPSNEASRNAKDIAMATFRAHRSTSKKLELEKHLRLPDHNGYLMYGTGIQSKKKLHIIVVGFSSKTTPQNLAATFLWWDNAAHNDHFVEMSKKIAESLGSY